MNRLQVEMDLWPRLRLEGVAVSLHDLLTILSRVGVLDEPSAQSTPQPADPSAPTP